MECSANMDKMAQSLTAMADMCRMMMEREMRRQPFLMVAGGIVLGKEWARWLLTGEARSVREVARKAGVTPSYASRLIRYDFLAPEISEAILRGARVVDLAAFGQAGVLPLDWKRQRRLAGGEARLTSKRAVVL
jgi:hypothetical protein